MANFKRHLVMSGEIGLESEAYILLAAATKIPCLNGAGERVAVAPPTRGKVPGNHLAARQDRQLAVHVDQQRDSTSTCVA